MHISAPFIRRPVATSLLSLALLLGGAVAYVLLPGVVACRRSSSPPSTCMRNCPAPVRRPLASSIATPLERQFGRIAGVTQMTSSSSTLGGSNITLQFDLNRNIDGAARDVQAAINAARAQLPANLPQNPQLLQVKSGRCADHDSGADLRPIEPAARSTMPPTRCCSRRSPRCRAWVRALSAAARVLRCASRRTRCSSAPMASGSSRCGPPWATSTQNMATGYFRNDSTDQRHQHQRSALSCA